MLGTFLVVKWLNSELPRSVAWIQSLVKKLRFHMPPGTTLMHVHTHTHTHSYTPREKSENGGTSADEKL